MSYNTRRQTGQGMGMGKGSPGMYHPRPRMPLQNSYQTSYSSQQSSHYSSQNQGGVQQHPPSQQQQQPPPPSQQSQQQSQPQSQPQVLPQPPPPPQLPQQQPPSQQPMNQQPPPPQPPQQPPQSQAAQQQPPQLLPPPPPPPQEQSPAAVKNEPPGTPVAGAQMEVDPDKSNDGSGETKPKPWQKKRFPAFKANKKIKKRRQNARLRKLLQPKNAMMVLHELKAGIKFTFQEHTNALTQTMFVVNAEVDGKVYVGQGLSKPVAKQNAAENALKALLLEKMSDAAMKAQQQDNAEVEPMQQEVNNGAGSGDSGEGSDTEGAGAPGRPSAPDDDVPWRSLASFALYKLFTEWQNQGTHVPIPVPKQGPVLPPPAASAQPVVPGAPSPMKKIPENPTDRHPVMLLNQLKPGIQFIEASREGTPPNLTFTMTVTVDGKTYNGVAKNKKEAKKEAAIACLAGSFNIRY